MISVDFFFHDLSSLHGCFPPLPPILHPSASTSAKSSSPTISAFLTPWLPTIICLYFSPQLLHDHQPPIPTSMWCYETFSSFHFLCCFLVRSPPCPLTAIILLLSSDASSFPCFLLLASSAMYSARLLSFYLCHSFYSHFLLDFLHGCHPRQPSNQETVDMLSFLPSSWASSMNIPSSSFHQFFFFFFFVRIEFLPSCIVEILDLYFSSTIFYFYGSLPSIMDEIWSFQFKSSDIIVTNTHAELKLELSRISPSIASTLF